MLFRVIDGFINFDAVQYASVDRDEQGAMSGITLFLEPAVIVLKGNDARIVYDALSNWYKTRTLVPQRNPAAA